MKAASTRAELHRLVDELPEVTVVPVTEYVRRATDPMVGVLDAAPEDDEPVTAEDEAAIASAEAAFTRGESVSLEALAGEMLGGRTTGGQVPE